MFKNKIIKIVFIAVLAVSLLLNVLLLMATKKMSDTQDAVTDCGTRAQTAVSGKVMSSAARKVVSDQIYDECLKTRYGIDQRFQ